MRASSSLPGLISQDNSESNNISGHKDDSNDDGDRLGQLHNDDGNAGDADNDTDEEDIVVGCTEAKDWTRVTQENLCAGRWIDPIPYTPCEGDGELFDVKISDEDLKGLIDKHGDLRFHWVHKLALPKLGKESYWE